MTRGQLIRLARKAADRLGQLRMPPTKWTQNRLGEAAAYRERQVRYAEADDPSVRDDCYAALAEVLLKELADEPPADLPRPDLLALLGRINDQPRTRPVRPVPLKLIPELERAASRHFALSLVELLLVVGAALAAGVVSALLWVWWFRGLGGTREPHGLDALLWSLVTSGPVLLVVGALLHHFRSDGWRSVLVDVLAIAVGFALGAWVFYGLPVGGTPGIRALVEGWPYQPRELLLVVIWSSLLAGGGFLALRWRPALGHPPVLRGSGLVRILIAVAVTSVPVWLCVLVLAGDQWEDARGLAAGLALRLGMTIAVAYAPGVDRAGSRRAAVDRPPASA